MWDISSNCHKTFTTRVSQNNSVTTQQCYNTTVSQHNNVTTQQCHNTTVLQLKICDSSVEKFKVLKCYNFVWVQRRHNCSPAASFANCVMTLHLLKVHFQTFISIPITQKCQILSCDTLVANERYVVMFFDRASWYIRTIRTNRMHYSLSIYFNN